MKPIIRDLDNGVGCRKVYPTYELPKQATCRSGFKCNFHQLTCPMEDKE